MSAYYTVNNPDDPLAVASTAVTRAQYTLWRGQADAVDVQLDSDAVYAPIVRSTGEGKWTVEHNLFALATLDELPRLRALVEELYHLDMKRLRAIESALAMADREYFPQLDSRITEYLTPTRANQPLPSPKAIKKRIQAMVNELDCSITTDQEDPDLPQLTYHVEFNADGTADLSARMDAASAAAVDKRVRALARKRGIGLAEAHALLVTGEDEGVTVTLNLYRAHDVPDAPTYLPRAGWLNPHRSAEWEGRATTTRDMDIIRDKVSRGYNTPEDIEACVEGIDDQCIFPCCEAPGEFCDNDHTVDYDDGGPTTAGNLRKLCRRHHNLKTSGHIRYVICPATGNAIFLFADGSWVENESDGPLAAENRRLVQTFRQRRDARNERVRAEAQEHRSLLYEAADVAHEGGDSAGGGEQEGEGSCPWSADLLTEADAEPQADGHADDAHGPHEPVGV